MRRRLLESLGLQRVNQNTWMVTARPPKGYAEYAGFDLGKPAFTRDGAIALTRVRNKFEKDMVQDGVAPADIEPMELVDVLKHGEPIKNDNGTVLFPEPDLNELVMNALVNRAVNALAGSKFDLVTNIASSKPFAEEFAKRVAQMMGKTYIPSAIIKTKDPERVRLELPDHIEPGSSAVKSAERNLDRFKRKMQAGEKTSVRNVFHTSQRRLVRGYLEPSDDALDVVTRPDRPAELRIVVLDDVLTSGQTAKEAKRELEEIGYDVVAVLAAFRAG